MDPLEFSLEARRFLNSQREKKRKDRSKKQGGKYAGYKDDLRDPYLVSPAGESRRAPLLAPAGIGDPVARKGRSQDAKPRSRAQEIDKWKKIQPPPSPGVWVVDNPPSARNESVASDTEISISQTLLSTMNFTMRAIYYPIQPLSYVINAYPTNNPPGIPARIEFDYYFQNVTGTELSNNILKFLGVTNSQGLSIVLDPAVISLPLSTAVLVSNAIEIFINPFTNGNGVKVYLFAGSSIQPNATGSNIPFYIDSDPNLLGTPSRPVRFVLEYDGEIITGAIGDHEFAYPYANPGILYYSIRAGLGFSRLFDLTIKDPLVNDTDSFFIFGPDL